MSALTLRLSDADRRHLITGAAALGIDLDRDVVSQLARFADILDLWAPKVNLLSCGSGRELVERHFLDSLAIAEALPHGGLVVDLGSGAGFPGIPLALLHPRHRWILVEVRRRRTSFLREVRRTLGLDQVEILEQRAEDPPVELAGRANAVVTRAVWSDTTLLEIASRWLSPGGRLLWMRSEPLPSSAEPGHLLRSGRVQYRIGNDRQRTVEIFAR